MVRVRVKVRAFRGRVRVRVEVTYADVTRNATRLCGHTVL
jgi:hypothetical protein